MFRGPALLEDFILREKLTHFDHERIPERIVHARGSAAHGVFECSASLAKYTRAAFLAEKGTRTPVFVRFSTVQGERGYIDTPPDPCRPRDHHPVGSRRRPGSRLVRLAGDLAEA